MDFASYVQVFIAPVLDVTDNPKWYHELDASPSGAMSVAHFSCGCVFLARR